MAKTGVLTGNALTLKKWEEKLFRDTAKESFFLPKFAGEGEGNIVQTKSQLEKTQGDLITFGIAMRTTGNYVTSGQTLEGNEQSLTTYSNTVPLEEYAIGIRDKGPLDRKRPIYDMDTVSKERLKDQGAEVIDQLIFNEMNNSTTNTIYGSGTTDATLTATGKITPAIVSKLKALAKSGFATASGAAQGARTQTPIRTVKVDGKEYYILLLHPFALYDWKRDPEVLQTLREAEVRGGSNPIFSGAVAVHDGVIIHEHENVPYYVNGGAGSNVPFCKGLFMGAQSMLWAWGERPHMVAAEFDYGREHGFSWQMIAGVKKTAFNSKDYGVIGVHVAATALN
jgi:N4-gp56 family major capsid protein